jgi:deoxyribodipyrimidine photo-lyase
MITQPKPVRKERLTPCNEADTLASGPVLYWMSRDQRVGDNWALLHAQQEALARRVPLAVVFCLVPDFLGATLRQFGFMLHGLAETEKSLRERSIGFVLLKGDPAREIPAFVRRMRAGLVVTDFDPLRIKTGWRKDVAAALRVPMVEVDAHNIVPARHVSPKAEYGAYTLRPKFNRLLPEFLTPIPPIKRHPHPWPHPSPPVDWETVRRALRVDRSVGEVTWLTPGSSAGLAMMRGFIATKLAAYSGASRDPAHNGLSNLSPYLHFGQLSAQRVAMEVKADAAPSAAKDAFLEELMVRRELADNFCLYNPHYDSTAGFPAWAARTLSEHARDKRPYLYSRERLEGADTHDDLWNAAQLEMVQTGKMHSYLRMYWAKKILEWTAGPEEALQTVIELNDRYELDGRDPSGYAGAAWSIGGTHDRAWGTRPVFGMIRYMTYNGCKSKFDIPAYIQRVKTSQK